MAVFINNLAFAGEPAALISSKMAILLASLTAGSLGFLWLRSLGEPAPEGVEVSADRKGAA